MAPLPQKRKYKVKLREEDGSDRSLFPGQPDFTRCDNTVITAKYNFLNFLPIVSIVFHGIIQLQSSFCSKALTKRIFLVPFKFIP